MDSQYEPHWSNYLNKFVDLPDECFQSIPTDTEKFCVIVEPREHPLLKAVLKNFMKLLAPRGWGLIVYHGTKNEEFVNTITGAWKNIYLRNIGVENLPISEYNKLFFTPDFWLSMKEIGCKHALIFQTDVVLLRDNIDDFLEYDYVGAPWNTVLDWTNGIEFPGGNGGFSLRNVDSMLECLYRLPPTHIRNEDGYFSFNCYRLGKRVAPRDISSTFSVETVYYETPCGLHKPFISLFPADGYSKLFEI